MTHCPDEAFFFAFTLEQIPQEERQYHSIMVSDKLYSGGPRLPVSRFSRILAPLRMAVWSGRLEDEQESTLRITGKRATLEGDPSNGDTRLILKLNSISRNDEYGGQATSSQVPCPWIRSLAVNSQFS